MKKVIFALLAIVLGMSACRKTEVYNEELTTDVVFKTVAVDNQTLLKSTGTNINPDAFGDDFITIAISGMNLSATHTSGGRSVDKQFNVVTDGSGGNDIKLENVSIGWNIFNAVTTSYVENPYTDPRGSESDGFSAWNKVSEYPFNGNEETSEEVVASLRLLPPFVEFIGESYQEVLFEGCEDDSCNEVEIDMEAQQGRLIVTVEFENIELAHYYIANCKMTHNGGAGPAPSVIADLDYTVGTNVPLVWFYYSHKSATEDVDINLQIDLKEKGKKTTLRKWILNSKDVEELSITKGVDRWLKITLTEEALTSNCTNFNFKWEWEKDNQSLDLGDCDGDSIPDEDDDDCGCCK